MSYVWTETYSHIMVERVFSTMEGKSAVSLLQAGWLLDTVTLLAGILY